MAKKSSKDAPRAPLALDADLRIGAAPALRDALLGALAAGEAVQLDGAAVAQVDTAGLQVLAAFSRDARAAACPSPGPASVIPSGAACPCWVFML